MKAAIEPQRFSTSTGDVERHRLAMMLAAVVALLFAAWVLRIYLLAGQSLWYDEGTTAALVPRDLARIALDAAHDIHPPLYYLVLHFWVGLAGNSEFALRLPSAIYSTVTVALVVNLGRRLFGFRIAILAAALSVFAPILVYYAQEARMYSQVMMLASLSTYLLARLMAERRVSRGLFVAYALATGAMLYSHYFAFAIVLAQAVYCLIECFTSGRRSFGALKIVLAAQIVAAAIFVPWLVISFGQLVSWPPISPPLTFDELIRRVLRAFTFGIGWEASYTQRREVALIVVMLAGLLGALKKRHNYLLPVCLVIVPTMAMYLLSLQRPMFNPKFLLPLAPAFYLTAAVGIVALSNAAHSFLRSRRLSASSGVAVVVLGLGLASFLYPAAAALQGYYFDAKYARDDYRALATFVADHSEPGDAIVLEAPGQIEIFEYYYRGALPRFPLPKQRPIDEAATAIDLTAISAQHRRVWLVTWATDEADPGHVVERWLVAHAAPTGASSYGYVGLTRYDFERSGS